MIKTQQTVPIESNFIGDSKDFGIDLNAKIFSVLSSNIYTDKMLAPIRELITNAWDSHIEAGKASTPIKIKRPSSLDTEFFVEDFGVGMSQEDIESIYVNYGSSTKENSNDFVGYFGIGSKSPLAYTDNYTIISYFNKMEYVYNISIGDGVPKLSKISEKSTERSNGMLISFNVASKDVDAFAKKLDNFILTHPGIFEVDNAYTPGKHEEQTYSEWLKAINGYIETDKYVVVSKDNGYSYGFSEIAYRVLSGGVCYTFDLEEMVGSEYKNFLVPPDKNKSELKKVLTQLFKSETSITEFMFKLPIGSVDISSSRETLELTDNNKKVLREAVESLFAYLIEDVFVKDIVKLLEEYKRIQCYASYINILTYYVTFFTFLEVLFKNDYLDADVSITGIVECYYDANRKDKLLSLVNLEEKEIKKQFETYTDYMNLCLNKTESLKPYATKVVEMLKELSNLKAPNVSQDVLSKLSSVRFVCKHSDLYSSQSYSSEVARTFTEISKSIPKNKNTPWYIPAFTALMEQSLLSPRLVVLTYDTSKVKTGKIKKFVSSNDWVKGKYLNHLTDSPTYVWLCPESDVKALKLFNSKLAVEKASDEFYSDYNSFISSSNSDSTNSLSPSFFSLRKHEWEEFSLFERYPGFLPTQQDVLVPSRHVKFSPEDFNIFPVKDLDRKDFLEFLYLIQEYGCVDKRVTMCSNYTPDSSKNEKYLEDIFNEEILPNLISEVYRNVWKDLMSVQIEILFEDIVVNTRRSVLNTLLFSLCSSDDSCLLTGDDVKRLKKSNIKQLLVNCKKFKDKSKIDEISSFPIQNARKIQKLCNYLVKTIKTAKSNGVNLDISPKTVRFLQEVSLKGVSTRSYSTDSSPQLLMMKEEADKYLNNVRDCMQRLTKEESWLLSLLVDYKSIHIPTYLFYGQQESEGKASYDSVQLFKNIHNKVV